MTALSTKNRGSSAQGRVVKGGRKKNPSWCGNILSFAMGRLSGWFHCNRGRDGPHSSALTSCSKNHFTCSKNVAEFVFAAHTLSSLHLEGLAVSLVTFLDRKLLEFLATISPCDFKIVALNDKKRAKHQSSPFPANTESHNHIFDIASSFWELCEEEETCH